MHHVYTISHLSNFRSCWYNCMSTQNVDVNNGPYFITQLKQLYIIFHEQKLTHLLSICFRLKSMDWSGVNIQVHHVPWTDHWTTLFLSRLPMLLRATCCVLGGTLHLARHRGWTMVWHVLKVPRSCGCSGTAMTQEPSILSTAVWKVGLGVLLSHCAFFRPGRSLQCYFTQLFLVRLKTWSPHCYK